VATDINEYRLNAALRFGADEVIHAEEDVPTRLRRVNADRLADLVIVCTGALRQMITHRLSLTETGLGFQLVADAGESIKVVIEPHR